MQAQKKKLSKRKRRAELSRSAERDRRHRRLVQPSPKGGRKLQFIKVRRAPLVTVLFESGGNESREKRMRLIRAGFEFRMILNADIEIPVRQFHRFDKSAVG